MKSKRFYMIVSKPSSISDSFFTLLNFLFFLTTSLFISSCSSTVHIIDDYCVSHEWEPYNELFCNPGAENDVDIEYVKSIKWNAKYMIIEQQKPDCQGKWYLLIAHGDSLRCCCEDSLIGPFSETELNHQLKQNNISTSTMKVKVFDLLY